jgi:hypothetical protein
LMLESKGAGGVGPCDLVLISGGSFSSKTG